MTQARYILIGGFLGAGKTTAIAALAEYLARKGRRVGVITNDQGSELVDTATMRAQGLSTEEIPGGCFCCRFDSLVGAVRQLRAAADPEVFLAEPVGSCTDLVATVAYPLRKLHGEDYVIAPVTALVDPVRAEQVLGLVAGDSFSEKVLYIYRKQLEEADLIVIGKTDLLDQARRQRLSDRLGKEFPQARILAVSTRTGEGLDEWFTLLENGHQGDRAAMDVDYAIYAEGEALLGWLNATVGFSHPKGVSANAALSSLAREIQSSLQGIEIAHLKIAFKPDEGRNIAVINLVRSDSVPESGATLADPVKSGELTINLRAEAAPAELHSAVQHAVQKLGKAFPDLETETGHLQYFRPGKPEPTHRMTSPLG